MYLTFAVALNFILNYGLPLYPPPPPPPPGGAASWAPAWPWFGAWSAQGQAGGADVLAAVPGGHGGMPLARQRGQHRRRLVPAALIARSTSFSAHSSGNSAAIITAVHLVELGVGDRRVERAALDDLGELPVTDPSRSASSMVSATPSMRMDM